MIRPLLSLIYDLATRARNGLYENNFFKSVSLGAPTFSVGNLTVGGTGKTPLVAFLAEILIERGEKVCILTRGYGRENSGQRVLVADGRQVLADVKKAGDEPFELARALAGRAVIVADKKRAAAGLWAREKFGVTAFVLDDGFQHRRVKRDLDIVCIDATNPFGNDRLLPNGILREPLQNLKRADAVVITRANLSENIADLKSQIAEYNADCPIFLSHNSFSNLSEIDNFLEKRTTRNEQLKTQNALAFCALGNPNNFFEQLKRDGFKICAAEIFPDHHFYTTKDVEKLEAKAARENIHVLLTTAKDAVKLSGLRLKKPCYVVENTLVFDDEQSFRELIYQKLGN